MRRRQVASRLPGRGRVATAHELAPTFCLLDAAALAAIPLGRHYRKQPGPFGRPAHCPGQQPAPALAHARDRELAIVRRSDMGA
jgi:hypothetical protein